MKSPSGILSDLQFRPSRMLGQNFLRYPEIPEKILDWANITDQGSVIEVGPGLGALTESLLNRQFHVTAIEKDRRLFDFLSQEYRDRTNLTLILGDALEVDFIELTSQEKQHVHLFSNLPYSISTPLIERFLRARSKIKTMTLLVQEEVALRMIADYGTENYGRLSIWIQTLGEPRMGPRIPKKAFLPEPKVESRLVQIRVREIPLIPEHHLELFLEFVGGLFQFRRKMIRKALELSRGQKTLLSNERLTAFLDKRAEQLSIQELYDIFCDLTH